MMKKTIKYLMIALVVVSTAISCTESDNAVDQLLNDVDRSGVIIRTLTDPLDFMMTGNPDMNKIDFTIEVQGPSVDGDMYPDFKEVRVYARIFEDQNLVTPTGNTEGELFEELLMQTLPAADFTDGDNDLPTANVYYNTQDIIAVNLDGVYPAPSFLETRLELEMTDGTIYSKQHMSTAVATGPYFRSPFYYVSPLIVN